MSLPDLRRIVASAHPGPLLLSVALATLTFPLRLWRWQLLLRRDDDGPLGLAPLWHAIAIGFMANNVLPFRMGEVIRGYTVSRLGPARLTAALGSIGVERIFDGLTVAALLALSLFLAHLPPDLTVGGRPVAHLATAMGVVMAAALVVALVVVRWPGLADQMIRRITPPGRMAERLVAAAAGLRHGLGVLRSPGRIAGVAAWSVVLWLTNALAFHVMFRAFDIALAYPAALLLQGVLVFGIAVPSTPGYVGVFEAAIKAVLLLFAIAPDRAVAYALTYHVATFLPIVLLGAWSLARTSIRLGEFRRAPRA